MFVLVFSIAIFFLMYLDKSSYYMVMMLRSLQLIVHVPLTNIMLQGYVINQLKIILPLLQFDILESTLDWHEQDILLFDKKRQADFEKRKSNQYGKR